MEQASSSLLPAGNTPGADAADVQMHDRLAGLRRAFEDVAAKFGSKEAFTAAYHE